MRGAIGAMAALLLVSAPGRATADNLHVAKGRVLAATAGAVRIDLVNGAPRTLLVRAETVISDDAGRAITAAGLGPGDLVREECRRLPDGRYVAGRVIVLQPAWRALGSPEE